MSKRTTIAASNASQGKQSEFAGYYEGRGGYRGPYHEYERLILDMLAPGRSLLDPFQLVQPFTQTI